MDTLLSLALKYGPALVLDVIEAMKKRSISVADVEATFAGVLPLTAFNISPPVLTGNMTLTPPVTGGVGNVVIPSPPFTTAK